MLTLSFIILAIISTCLLNLKYTKNNIYTQYTQILIYY
nr:MAG TPA: hypothetical protein [Caudoviricetes sp.]